MKAILIQKDNSLKWTDVPDPARKSDEVIVDIHAAALNRADLLQRAGQYPPPPGSPEWMGLEVAGVISEAGETASDAGYKTGDKVCALLGGGGYAERVAVRPGMLLPLPEGLTMAEGASLPEAYATSYLNLKLEGKIKAGETVLIHAGASGLGIAAIQLAKYYGARVMTTVGSRDKAEAVAAYGADIVVDRKKEDISEYLDKYPVDLVFDCVGGPMLGEHFGKLARGGRWIMIATLGGTETSVPLRPLLTKGLRLIGSTLRSRAPEMKERIISEIRGSFWNAFASGKLRPAVYRELPVSEAEEAHAILQRSENIGKVVLNIKQG